MEFPREATSLVRRCAVGALVIAAALTAAGFGLSAIAFYEVAERFRDVAAGGIVSGDEGPIGALLDAGRALLTTGAALAVLGLLGLAVAAAAAWPTRDAKRALRALAIGVGVAFLVTMLDQIGARPGDASKPMFLGLAAIAIALCVPRRAALVVAIAGAAAFLARTWHAAQYPPWFEPRDHLLPREGAEAAWAAMGFVLLAAALALAAWKDQRGKPRGADPEKPQASSGIL